MVELIGTAVERVRARVPAFANLRLVLGLELTSGGLAGPARSQRFRVELPGPNVTEGESDDERIRVSVPAPMFRVLAEEGDLADWREAFHHGHLAVEGDARVKRLLGEAIERASGETGRPAPG